MQTILDLKTINNTLQVISDELRQWELSAYLENLEDEAFENYMIYMENLLSAYSYCEE